ncbi:hypothetical protein DYB28_007099, partial [Aphanomyces astaci]
AGIQADMKACTAQGVFSTSALTAITVYNGSLLQSEAHRSLVTDLFPIALLITPNLPEASVLLDGRVIASVADMQQAAVDLMALGRSKFVLVKGGHLESDTVVDVLYDGESFDLFSSPRVHTTNT